MAFLEHILKVALDDMVQAHSVTSYVYRLTCYNVAQKFTLCQVSGATKIMAKRRQTIAMDSQRGSNIIHHVLCFAG